MKIYELFIQQLVLWIFVKENLILMLNLDPKFTFDICYLFFTGLTSDTIRKFHNYLKIDFKEVSQGENIFIGKIYLYFLNFLKKKDEVKSPQIKMLKMIFSIEEELFNSNNEQIYSKQQRVWLLVFLARIIEIDEYKIDSNICYKACLFLINNQDILNVLFISNELLDIEIEKSKFGIKILKYSKESLSIDQIDHLINSTYNMYV